MPRRKNKTDLEREAGIDPEELPKDRKKGANYTAITTKLAEERLKRLKKQNAKATIELKQMQGEVGDIEKIKREVLAANQTVKQLFLAIPFRLAMQLASVTEPREIHTILEKAITEALNDLAYEREQ